MKKTLSGLIATATLFATLGGSVAFAADSTVTGTVAAGELSMTAPDNATFTATLNGSQQTVPVVAATSGTNTISTTVTDYRGVEAGWNISVASSDYATYNSNFTLTVGGIAVTDTAATVDNVTTRTQEKAESFATNAVVSATAVPGEFAATLNWTLTPSTEAVVN